MLRNPELWNNAAWVLWKIAGEKEVHERALSLLRSENPHERASAVYILNGYFKNNLNALEEFKNDPSTEVRQSVLGTFFETKMEDKVREFANDPSEDVRRTVFLFFESEGGDRRFCVFASGFNDPARCETLLTEKWIVFQLPNKTLFVKRDYVVKSRITTNGRGRFGVHLEFAGSDKVVQEVLLVPLDRYAGIPESMSSERMSRWLYSSLNRLPETDETQQIDSVDDLWSKIPVELFSPNPAE